MFSKSKLYFEDIKAISSKNINWEELNNKKILITGASGLIGAFLIDLLMYRNNEFNNKIIIYAVGRSKEKAMLRFKEYFDSQLFIFIEKDIQTSFTLNYPIDYIIHGASNTHPVAYASEPINTILLSVTGTKNILDLAFLQKVKRILFISTVEIYGENRGDTDTFKEDYCGYIDCNTLRAGYPEGKRAAEALCQAYKNEKNLDIVIARSCRVYGATMGNDDSKVIAQFIKNSVRKEDIVLKSTGDQLFSYCYIADICSALLFLLLNGENGEAYNISNNEQIPLNQIANILSEYVHSKVIFNSPDSLEASGFSKATKALLDSSKLNNLGWKPLYSLKDGLIRTVDILCER